ncbi:alpha/beta fold hydrolase [Natrinema versiforme]|uniref:Alpha/beta fold hydrolase n=1 Tax=Natrinema versiforme TaxID=88724 RepID=A0A4P8WHP3_9EURY|nr:alpha/beta hydrolase [Natrinema versiforme]QCS42562.1 alpha/beta fold hydrolase [Natrinema versiforme]
MRSDTGELPGSHPYVRTGTGRSSRALVVLPGIGDAMFSGTYPSFSGWGLAPYFARYLDEYTVYVLSRPRGLPAGYDPDDAVDSHERAFAEIADGNEAVDVIGVSMGGLIAQELARRRPDLVDRLVLANSTARIADDAESTVREFERHAREHDWASIRSGLAAVMFSDARAITYPPTIQTVGRFLQPRPAEPADVWRSLEFAHEFDSRDRLEEIDRPTLVFGGGRDPIFPPPLTREIAVRIPDGTVTLAPGSKHAAFHERKLTFDSRVRSFLER